MGSLSSKKLSPRHSTPNSALTLPAGTLNKSGLESLKSNVFNVLPLFLNTLILAVSITASEAPGVQSPQAVGSPSLSGLPRTPPPLNGL